MATMSNHKRTSSRDNSYGIDEDLSAGDCCFQEEQGSGGPPKFIVEHIDEKNLMDVSLLESKHGAKRSKDLYEDPMIKKYDISIKKEDIGFVGEDLDDDCTTVTLSTTTSDRSGSNNNSDRSAGGTKRTTTRLLLNPWAARFVRTNAEKTVPLPLSLDQTHSVSPLSTPSPTNQKSRKVFDEQQVLETTPLPPLKQFGAQSETPPITAALQIQSLEAIMMAKNKNNNKENDGRWGGHWWSKEQREKEQQLLEDASVAAESTTSSMKSTGERTASFRWGRFLGSSSNMPLDGDETTLTGGDGEESQEPTANHHQRKQRKSWKNRFSFRPSQMDTMLDDIDDPYFDSISLSSECSSSFGGSSTTSSSAYTLGSNNDPMSEQIGANENDTTTTTTTTDKQQRRRWSRLWRAQEFSRDAPTVHMI